MIALWLLAVSCAEPTDNRPDDSNCTDTFFLDADGDGHGDAAHATTACDVPVNYTASSDDCDDADPAIRPGADERCNGLDDDCDTEIDEGAVGSTSFYIDADLDGFGAGVAVVACAPPSGYTAIAGDCADDDPDVNPDAYEICNGLDDDCNGATDSLDPGLDDGSVYYADADGDGYGDPATGMRACEKAADRTLDDSDCDDLAATAHPGGAEVCGTGIDEDCDLAVDNCVLSSADADVFVEGPERTGFGMTIGVLDLNGDGVADLALSNWFQANQAGAVYVAYGPVTAGTTTDDMVTLTADVEDGYFGWKVAGGDANGDGLDDLLVGAAQDTLADAYLFLGPVTADGVRTDADAVLDGDVDTASGWDVDILSDFDGDGAADFAIGAPDANRAGALYVVAGPVSGRVHLPDATYTFQGLGGDDALGTASTSLGDTNGDGIDDLAVGSPYDGNGAVYIVDGGETSGTYDIDTVAASSLGGPEFESAFGSALASADYDGDGTADVFVSAIFADAPGNSDAGAVYAFLGPFAGELDTGDAVATWANVDPDPFGFGYDIAAGDVDADGQVDVLMGCPYIGGVSTDGLAYLQLGSASGNVALTSLVTIQGRSREGLGMGVAFVPDWTGDGGAEVAIGGPGYRDASEDDIGALYLFASERFHP